MIKCDWKDKEGGIRMQRKKLGIILLLLVVFLGVANISFAGEETEVEVKSEEKTDAEVSILAEEITKIRAEVPTQKGTVTYSGREEKFSLSNFDEEIMTVANNTGTNAGEYEVIVSLTDPEKYEWVIEDENGDITYSSEPQKVKCKIAKKSIDCSDERFFNVEWLNKEMTFGETEEFKTLAYNYVTRKYICEYVSGDTAKDVGGTFLHRARIRLLDTQNYKLISFNSSTKQYDEVEEATIWWQIVRARIYGSSYRPSQRTLTYTGEEQDILEPLSGYQFIADKYKDLVEITGNKGTEIGKYDIICHLKYPESSEWYNGGTEDMLLFSWEIVEKKPETILVSIPNNVSYSYNGSAQSFNKNIAEISYRENGKYRTDWTKDVPYTVVFSQTGTDVGTYTAVVSIKDKTRYGWGRYDEDTGSITVHDNGDKTVKWSITKATLALYLPSQRLLKDYTGKEQEVTVKDFSNNSSNDLVNKGLIQISGNKAKKIGNYQVTLKVTDTKNVDKIQVYRLSSNGKSYSFETAGNTVTLDWGIVSNEQVKLETTIGNFSSSDSQGVLWEIGDKEKVTIKASHSSGIKKLYYQIGDESVKSTSKATASFTIPTSYTNQGVLQIKAMAIAKDGTESEWEIYEVTPTKVIVPPTFTLTADGVTVDEEELLEVGDKSKVVITAAHASGIKKLYYQIGNEKEKTASKATATVTIPTTYTNQGELEIKVKALTKEGNESEWITYKINPTKIIVPPTFTITADGATVGEDELLEVGDKSKVVITAAHASGIKKLYYQIGNEKEKTASKATATVTIPTTYTNQGELEIKVKALSKEGNESDWVTYKINPIKIMVPPTISAKVGEVVLTENEVIEVGNKAKLTITASHSDGIKKVYYQIGDAKAKSASKASTSVTIPATYTNQGELAVKVMAVAKDGAESEWITYLVNPVK